MWRARDRGRGERGCSERRGERGDGRQEGGAVVGGGEVDGEDRGRDAEGSSPLSSCAIDKQCTDIVYVAIRRYYHFRKRESSTSYGPCVPIVLRPRYAMSVTDKGSCAYQARGKGADS
eukprot:1441143-Rhodomonas_salina.1